MPATEKSIPVTLDDSQNGSIRQLSEANEDWFAYLAAEALSVEYPEVSDRYNKSLTLSPINSSLIGSFTDTFYNEPVGTHPATSISEGTTTTNLYQMNDSASPAVVYSHTPFPLVTDSSGDIFEMPDDAIQEFGNRIAGLVAVNQFAGAFRISSTSPGPGWSIWIDSAFTDTRTSTDIPYHIWRLSSVNGAVEPDAPNSYLLKLKDDITSDIQEMTLAETTEVLREALLIGQAATGVGDYELRSSAQGAPTNGTWVARGVATDTKHLVQDVQYASTQFTSPTYSSQYTGQYAGTYTGVSFADVPVQYAGVRDHVFGGDRTYSGQYVGSRTYSGDYAGSRNYGAQYVGPRSYAGIRSFAGFRSFGAQYGGAVGSFVTNDGFFSRTGNFKGSRDKPANFAGVRNITYGAQYGGFRPYPFAGNRGTWVPQGFNGVRFMYMPYPVIDYDCTNYQGAGTGNYTGIEPIESCVTFQYYAPRPVFVQGGREIFVPTLTEGTRCNYSTSSNYRPYPITNFSQSCETQYLDYPFILNFNGVYFRNVFAYFLGYFLGPSPDNFAGSRVKATPQNFAGVTTYGGNYGGVRSYAGTRVFVVYTPVQYAGSRPKPGNFSSSGQFTGPSNFAGSRNYGKDYSGSRNYGAQYQGDRTYSGNYTGPRGAQFTGLVPTTYTAQYTGVYSGVYTGNFTSQYSNQYTGQTITALTETIETYTLYCRVSDN